MMEATATSIPIKTGTEEGIENTSECVEPLKMIMHVILTNFIKTGTYIIISTCICSSTRSTPGSTYNYNNNYFTEY